MSDEQTAKPQGDIHATSEPAKADAGKGDVEATPQGDIHATDEPLETKDIHATSEPFKPAK
ncbi:hypothetical protein HCJ93_14785 [Streptomyces sp. SBST2-5]|uniref:Sigma-like protein n=1 Tax=Streptomyces composti TaxID=2720025 RepID=A0ABX1A4E9_9ACTN|nr:hypothetical protein [Streptomyces composti]NJP51305.1 hypothetical protein [Streptomyces composti]